MTKERIRTEADTIVEIMRNFKGDDRKISAAPIYEIQDEKMKEKGLYLLVSWELAEDTNEEENHLFFDLRDQSNSHYTATLPERMVDENNSDNVFFILDYLFYRMGVEEKEKEKPCPSYPYPYLFYYSYSFDEDYAAIPCQNFDHASFLMDADIKKEVDCVEMESGFTPAVIEQANDHKILVYDKSPENYKEKEYIEYRILEVGRGM